MKDMPVPQEAGHIKNTVSSFDFPAHPMFPFDELWGSLGTRIFRNSSSATDNTPLRLPSTLSFRFLWLCLHIYLKLERRKVVKKWCVKELIGNF